MHRTISEAEAEAKAIFAGGDASNPRKLLQLAKTLRDTENKLEYSRRLLEIALDSLGSADQETRFQIRRDLMLCTYKSPDQPVDERLKHAQQIGESLIGDVALTPKQLQDVLGVMGAVWKARWSAFGLREHLEKSLKYYREGTALGVELDEGYTAINAAFVLDLLAATVTDEHARAALAGEATRLRRDILAVLLPLKAANPSRLESFWFLATLGEACLGLRDFVRAQEWMERAGKHHPRPWQLESAARQAAKLASLIAAERNIAADELVDSDPWKVVNALVGGDPAAACSFLLGKVGLALSGGGFRASLFHIGVLAKLAELDMLRHVEVISCVSGGSIVGAYYYLELRHLLQSKRDEEIKRADYIDLVRRIEHNFLEGVQRNIRLRMLMEFGSNLRVLVSRKSSTTDRLATLYDRELYSRIEDEFQGTSRRLCDIFIRPLDAPDGFNCKYDNWTRLNKVPNLILNATTLNTCHNWQFTASYMGEPPGRGIDADIDANDRLRRMYHEDAPPSWKETQVIDGKRVEKGKVTLSEAVAASACVPPLFDPLVLDDLYGTTLDPRKPDKYVARLVDGGAYDNQGVASLLEQDCTVLLVSDASGQTSVALDPGGKRLGILQRANGILMARVREAQYHHLATLRDSGALRGLMYVHLKKDLAGIPVDWFESRDRPRRRKTPDPMTRYSMIREVQRRLAAVRTDLDSFSDCEADALMLSGYLMTGRDFDACIHDFRVPDEPPENWRFSGIAGIAATPGGSSDTPLLCRALDVAGNISWKPLRASGVLKALTLSGGVLALAGVVYLAWANWKTPLPLDLPAGKSVALIAGILTAAGAIRLGLNRLRYRNPWWQILVSLCMCAVGWIFLRLYLYLIEPFYLRFGPKYRQDPAPGIPSKPMSAAAGGD